GRASMTEPQVTDGRDGVSALSAAVLVVLVCTGPDQQERPATNNNGGRVAQPDAGSGASVGSFEERGPLKRGEETRASATRPPRPRGPARAACPTPSPAPCRATTGRPTCPGGGCSCGCPPAWPSPGGSRTGCSRR